MNLKRLEKVYDKMKEKQIGQLLVTDPVSIFYLTGKYLEPGERFFCLRLSTMQSPVLFLNRLFPMDAVEGLTFIPFGDGDDVTALTVLALDPNQTLGIDKNMPAKFLIPLMDCQAAAKYVLASDCIDSVRQKKDPMEQEKMKDVSAINDQAMDRFRTLVSPGVTEIETAEKLLSIYRELGADDHSFEPIVAFGANAADPHHMPDQTVLKEGDGVLFDVGCRKEMYCADMTRTFFYGKTSELQEKVYHLVQKANEEAILKIRPGVPLKEIDNTARSVIADAGYGEYFTHRLGHFIGIEVHESGDVSQVSELIAEPGMIFSIEPGIYLPGEVGVRIEDLVMVTDDGCIRLNQYSKELEILS